MRLYSLHIWKEEIESSALLFLWQQRFGREVNEVKGGCLRQPMRCASLECTILFAFRDPESTSVPCAGTCCDSRLQYVRKAGALPFRACLTVRVSLHGARCISYAVRVVRHPSGNRMRHESTFLRTVGSSVQLSTASALTSTEVLVLSISAAGSDKALLCPTCDSC